MTGELSRWMPVCKPESALPALPTLLLQAVDQVKDRARAGFDASPAPALNDAVSRVTEAAPGARDAARQSSESASNTADQLQEASQDAGQAVDSVTPDIRPDKQVGSPAALVLLAPTGCKQFLACSVILFAGSISRRGLLLGPVGCFAFKATRSRRLQLLCTEALLGWGLQALIQKLERDVLPKIEGQIAELNKADEPTDTTRAIKDQLEVGHWSRIRGMHRFLCMASNLLVSALTLLGHMKSFCMQGMKANITQLLTDVRGGNNVGIQQDATGLQNIFAALREAIPKLNGDSGSG